MTSELILKNARFVSTNKIINCRCLALQSKKNIRIQLNNFHDEIYENNKDIIIINYQIKSFILRFVNRKTKLGLVLNNFIKSKLLIRNNWNMVK